MAYTIDNERIKEVAESLGSKVIFNSDNPGIYFSETDEHFTWDQTGDSIMKMFVFPSEDSNA